MQTRIFDFVKSINQRNRLFAKHRIGNGIVGRFSAAVPQAQAKRRTGADVFVHFIKKIIDTDIQNFADVKQAAAADAVQTAFILLNLLKG